MADNFCAQARYLVRVRSLPSTQHGRSFYFRQKHTYVLNTFCPRWLSYSKSIMSDSYKSTVSYFHKTQNVVCLHKHNLLVLHEQSVLVIQKHSVLLLEKHVVLFVFTKTHCITYTQAQCLSFANIQSLIPTKAQCLTFRTQYLILFLQSHNVLFL